MTEKTRYVELPDGRRLAYVEYGVPDGRPLFYFHGLPGSRLEHHPDSSLAEGLGVRIITCDRPGMGESTFVPDRRFLDWPKDVAAVADSLGIDRFHVMGISGGTPYTLACIHAMPERLRGAAIVSGIGPLSLPGAFDGMIPLESVCLRLAGMAPWLLPVPFAMIARHVTRDRDSKLKGMVLKLPPADLAVGARREIQVMFGRNFQEATRQGGRGPAREAALLAGKWDFDPATISPSVPLRLWHGDADTIVPVTHGRWYERTLPNCRATFLPGEGHYLVFEHYAEIIGDLLALGGDA